MTRTKIQRVHSLDGAGFAQALYAGTLAVVAECDNLDRINVFPVADADTGANLAATLRAASARLGADAPSRIGAAARLAADAALDGARGNSGAIFAQFLCGLAESFSDRPRVGTREFADGAARGSQAAWDALQNPREGTILSVLRAWAQGLAVGSARTGDFGEALDDGLQAARHALAETPRQLAVLARHRVVDAGGQGFVYFLEGMLDWVCTGKARRQTAVLPAIAPRPFTGGHNEVDPTYRFCAEALVSGVGIDTDQIKARVAPLGDSLVVAGGGSRVRIHLHTNAPLEFLTAAAGVGAVEASKVDDMILQQLGGRESTIALVCDSTCDLPESLAHHLGVVRVPLTLTVAGRQYRDGLDMTAVEFYRRLPGLERLPTSSQPAVSEFREVYERLLEHHEGVVSLHIAGALSGTVEAARSAAAAVGVQRVRVVDTHKVSIGVGLLLEVAGAAIAAGAGLDVVEDRVLAARRQVALFGIVGSLDQAVKGGRVSPRAARVIEAAHLYPVIAFDDEGHAQKAGVAAGLDGAMRALVKKALRFAGGEPARAMVVHTDRLEAAEAVAESLCRRLGTSAIPLVPGGPVLTTHVGLGSVTIGVRRDD
jgi:DegV family protein with EDD domain